MLTSAADQELLARQTALQAEGAGVLAGLDLGSLFGDVGPVLVVGSYVSGLMCWRDLDVGLLAGVAFSPADVLDLLKRVVELPGFARFTDRDERGRRRPTRGPVQSRMAGDDHGRGLVAVGRYLQGLLLHPSRIAGG